jgi:hypothetical protein
MVKNFIANHQPQALSSSSGFTGRSSNPRVIDSIAGACDYWIPAFAGMTVKAGMTEKEQRGTQ